MEPQKSFRPLFKTLGIILGIAVLVIAIGVFIFTNLIKAPHGNNTINPIEADAESTNKNHSSNPDNKNSDLPKEQVQNIQNFSFLVACKDQSSGCTDTIMLVYLDINDQEVNILNIPRDTMLKTDRDSKKINSSYSLGGIEQFEKDIASLTGFYVNRYVLFDLKGVEEIIDAIGGVYFDIPVNMNYEDPSQDLYIHFKKGYKHLYGKDVVKVARYRNYPDGDIGRIKVQQDLIKSIDGQALRAENILKIPELVSVINQNVETDIVFSEMLWLANELKNVKLSSIRTDIVPGVASTIDDLSYWLPYKNELLDLINNRYNPLDNPITEGDISIVSYWSNKEG